MRICECLVLLSLTLVVILPAATSADESWQIESGFVAMFNGQDFSGWQFGGGYHLPQPQPQNWLVEDQVIKVTGGGRPHLGSQWDYQDFDMRFQWRALREKYNSGFFIRSKRKVGNNQINLAKGGEGRFFGGKMQGGKPVPELQNAPQKWNDWRVLVVGSEVKFWCNGKLAWEGTEFQTARGHIGLQAEGAPLEFRRLRIKELGCQYLVLNSPQSKFESKRRDYQDYVARLEFRATGDAVAQLALRGRSAPQSIVELGALEVGSGSVPKLDLKPVKKLDNPAGQWNYLQASVTDNRATIWLNGVDVVKDAKLSAERGGLDLVSGSDKLQVRNVRIRPVESQPR